MRPLNRLFFPPVGTLLALGCALVPWAQARVVTVTTADNLNPPPGQRSLHQALLDVQAGDEIRFNLPGDGPFRIVTPPGGYPLITRNGVVIDGYSQPGAAANRNPFLVPNNARLQIILDSTNGNCRLLDFAGDSPDDATGYGPDQGAVLGVVGATNFVLRGVSLLSVPRAGELENISMQGVAFAKGASGRISGCWIGVHPDGQTWAGPAYGVTGFRYLVREADGTVASVVSANGVVLGVGTSATNAPADFNVWAGILRAPVAIEGDRTRVAGNFLGVLPDGLHDVNLMFDPALAGSSQGFIGIWEGGDGTVIGTDGDGVNDAHERNLFGGMLPPELGGYGQAIEFRNPPPGAAIVIAGNQIGVGIDGQTRFTNAVPVLNATGDGVRYRLGSNLDRVSDAVEANVIANQWPPSLFGTDYWMAVPPANLNFFSALHAGATVSARGNRWVANLAFPASPLRDAGAFLTNYYARALVAPTNGLVPVIAAGSTALRLQGSVPLADRTAYPETWVDLYRADPEGIELGRSLFLPELPDGFVQGAMFLGSFRDNGPLDRDSTDGVFDLDLSGLGLVEGLVTITANYVSAWVGGEAPVLTSPFSLPVAVSGGGTGELRFTSIALTAGGVRMEWSGGGELQAAPALGATWQTVPGASSPYVVPASGGQRLFRLKR